ncbi:hypothetical protein [Pedobacter sp. N23S346]|uniref:hypothetical protein n=1 Tax=Pedobacter sp. N23S346 TaxID=3402750 RepID=UPI003ABF0F56
MKKIEKKQMAEITGGSNRTCLLVGIFGGLGILVSGGALLVGAVAAGGGGASAGCFG